MSERVTITTSDNITIVADWYPVPDLQRFAILLHMRPATKESWKRWAKMLNEKGMACLAYDQRGHGESTADGTLNFETLGEAEAMGKPLDLEAAFAWLGNHGASESNTILIGASIGANLAIRFAAEHANTPCVVALSPGVNFRGVTTDDAIKKFSSTQKGILVASDDDPHGSFESAKTLHELAPDRTILIQKSGIGHGTTMLENDPNLFEEILKQLP